MLQQLVYIVIALIIVGGLLYLIQLIPIDATIKKIIFVLVLIVVAIAALKYVAGMSF